MTSLTLQCLLGTVQRPERREPSRLPCPLQVKKPGGGLGDQVTQVKPHNEQARVLAVQVSAIVFHVARFFVAFRRQSTANGERAALGLDQSAGAGRDREIFALFRNTFYVRIFVCKMQVISKIVVC